MALGQLICQNGFELKAGFHGPECDDLGPFTWSSRTFLITRPPNARYATVRMCYYGDEGRLRVRDGCRPLPDVPLHRGWDLYPLDVSEATGREIEFEIDRVIPVPGDSRELGVMIRSVRALASAEEYRRLKAVADNRLLNETEFHQGRALLKSCPTHLRIDIEPRCNIKPPCIYCNWELARHHEAGASLGFSVGLLKEMGEFYDLVEEVVDCSYGEPFLSRETIPLLADLARTGKYFEMTSNGQLLNEANRRAVLGKNMTLYVSLDVATAAAYARYRNNRFDDVVANLRELCRQKRESANLPRVMLSFLAMRSNREELETFLGLAVALGVDAIKIRSLDAYEDVRSYRRERVTVRNGFRFDYAVECLCFDEFQAFADRARAAAREWKVPIIVDIATEMPPTATGEPLCREPWYTFHPLKRGIHVCSYAREPIASWKEQGNRPVAEFLASVWNGEPYQEVRRGLAAERLPAHCRQCRTCPLVRQGKIA
jgi:MoaA/NifB/PqqE/SkfB family radical SAM enzyme